MDCVLVHVDQHVLTVQVHVEDPVKEVAHLHVDLLVVALVQLHAQHHVVLVVLHHVVRVVDVVEVVLLHVEEVVMEYVKVAAVVNAQDALDVVIAVLLLVEVVVLDVAIVVLDVPVVVVQDVKILAI